MSIVSSLLILLLSLTSFVSATVDGWDYSKGSSQKIRGVNLGSFIDFLSLVLDFQFRLETHVLTLSPPSRWMARPREVDVAHSLQQQRSFVPVLSTSPFPRQQHGLHR